MKFLIKQRLELQSLIPVGIHVHTNSCTCMFLTCSFRLKGNPRKKVRNMLIVNGAKVQETQRERISIIFDFSERYRNKSSAFPTRESLCSNHNSR